MVSQLNKKEIILSAGVKVFSKKGFHKASMDDIAKLANVSKGSLYLYFKSKEALFLEIVEQGFKELIESIEKVYLVDASPILKLKQAMLVFYRFLNEREQFFTMMMFDAPRLKKRHVEISLKDRIDKLTFYFVEIIKQGIKAGEIKALSPFLLNAFIGGVVRGVFFHRIIDKVNFGEKDYFDQLFEIIETGIVQKRNITHSTRVSNITYKPSVQKNNIFEQVLEVVEEVFKFLGCGINNDIYAEAISFALRDAGIVHKRNVSLNVYFKKRNVGTLTLPILLKERIGIGFSPVSQTILKQNNIDVLLVIESCNPFRHRFIKIKEV